MGFYTFVGELEGSIGPGGSLNYVTSSGGGLMVVNGDTYSLSNLSGAGGDLTGTLTAYPPGSVPEPCSLTLMGLGGVAVLAARRFYRKA